MATPTPTQGTRDRVIRMEGKIDDLDAKVAEMHQLLTQAKGARWMSMLMIGFGGSVVAKITPVIQYALGG